MLGYTLCWQFELETKCLISYFRFLVNISHVSIMASFLNDSFALKLFLDTKFIFAKIEILANTHLTICIWYIQYLSCIFFLLIFSDKFKKTTWCLKLFLAQQELAEKRAPVVRARRIFSCKFYSFIWIIVTCLHYLK